jgi:tRNA(fMet)-specific endonuclease VapC
VYKAILDTDILSEILKGKDANVRARSDEYLRANQRLAISVVTVMEVVKGFHKASRAEQMQRFVSGLGSVEIIAMSTEIAILAGKIYADLERSGQPIGRADPMIAATALAEGRALVSGNQAHYERIVGLGYHLKLENWRSS